MSSFQTAEQQLRTLLERFANGASLQPLLDAIAQVRPLDPPGLPGLLSHISRCAQIREDADKDESLRAWLKELDSYIRRVLQEPGYVMRDDCDRDGRKVMDDGRQVSEACCFWRPTCR